MINWNMKNRVKIGWILLITSVLSSLIIQITNTTSLDYPALMYGFFTLGWLFNNLLKE
nr:hypothetical protein [Methanobrevibacter arboriphilus]